MLSECSSFANIIEAFSFLVKFSGVIALLLVVIDMLKVTILTCQIS